MTIVEFLEARIAEDEAIAREAIDPDRPGTHWKWEAPDDYGDDPEAPLWLRTVEEFPTTSGVGDLPAFPVGYDFMASPSSRGMAHIARHDPARVLRQCAALRGLVEWHVHINGSSVDDIEYPIELLTYLAGIWSDHPDYRQEWA
ncbi:DUF6221 family protein [Rhodococcus gordoniae]|uniref:DUF6221 family protein n=1 Tax=Rhodococcus gordoniae TaxID=223392 RepID=UPI003525F231